MASIEMFKKIPLFRELTNAELIKVSNLTQKVSFHAGDTIFNKGDAGDALYLVREGEVEVLAPSPEAEDIQVVVAELGPGQLFGEMALVEGEPRSAAIRAKNDAKLLRIRKQYFDQMMKNEHEIALKIYKRLTIILSGRLRDTTERLAIANQIIRMTSDKQERSGK